MLIICSALFPREIARDIGLFQGMILPTLVLILSLQNLFKKVLKIPKDYFTLFFFLFFLLNLTSALWAYNISLVWKKTAMYLVMFVLYINVRSLDLNQFNIGFWRKLFVGILIANILSIFWSFYIIAFDDTGSFLFSNKEILNSTRVFHTNGNYISSLLLMLFPFSLLIADQKKSKKFIAYTLSALLIYLILIYNSRASALGLIAVIAIYSLQYFKIKKTVTRIVSSLLLVSSFILIAYFVIDNPSEYFEQYNPLRTVFEDTGDDRPILWKNSMKLFSEAPLLGVGSGNWIIEIRRYGNNEYANHIVYSHAHNFFIESLTEIGILGGLNSVLLFLIPIFSFIKNRAKNNTLSYLILFIVGFSIVASFYGVVYLDLRLMLIWSFVMAWFYNQINNSFFDKSIFTFVLLSSLFLLSISYFYYLNIANHKLRAISRSKETPIQILDKIYLPYVYEFRFSDHLLRIKANNLQRTEHGQLTNLYETVLKKNPYDHAAWTSQGINYELQKDFETALKYYKEAIKINDLELRAYLGIIRVASRKKYWNEYDFGASVFENTIIPSKEKHYNEDLLVSKNHIIQKFWFQRCHYLDQYYGLSNLRNNYYNANRHLFDNQKNQ